MLRRRDVIAGLDLKRITNSKSSSISSGAESVDARRTVKVAARVRGFTSQEVKAHCKRSISVDGDRISVVKSNVFADADAETVAAAAQIYSNSEWASNFTFDNCFWTGQSAPSEGLDIDKKDGCLGQTELFDEIGSELVENVLNGFSSSCFAYGHKASGKSYTMFGPSEGGRNSLGICQKSDGAITLLKSSGLIPRAMTQIVASIRKAKDTCDDTAITLSFAEVHNDKAYDLLRSPSPHREPEHSFPGPEDDLRLRERRALKLREHPTKGPYVEDLRACPIKTPADVLRLLEEGLRRRVESARGGHSRGHCMVTLELSPSKAFVQAQQRVRDGGSGSGGGRGSRQQFNRDGLKVDAVQ